ncbi:MAG: UDP-N-acetylmuramate--L-alanine ligase [Nitrospirae bacterium CG18_big_fil_WC_8_21_14_2_50_70_55]|nr:UDP-N-acetylmuramate--L-alanine ligase [Deltaproteobacteria bacterium]OIP66716.1 MAG: UDP-N-acetylmuramate--L-alanine ligase [Nitrospirae bacterium CG2_30_70_394]PIQ06759.1 MAG: UDP-N-acetylmuramate--L-alanine ligase [Nitrospirae bacterium CG18_big_fil_WC_8_21_14_2_50_70_55]PIU80005.1 MAG: UDP-N-acetylmuramate--L-alanine ligase [Nitrospirae bacterium CG06_land_8_20_14_3_00_70_43]PIW83165.1 MAG: UDP-N-acetylmuramate--L-alanine ligase [Nitrospirae bacterium CG_4_8_14_3_um_filter_70_85]PIX8264
MSTSLFQTAHHVHFMGIGGVGMSGIAEILVTLGHRVSGCDLKENDAVARLRAHGASVAIGHHPDHVAGCDVVVTSSAVRPDHPEIVAARAARIPVIPRAEMLAELMRLKYGVAVAGAHGKTTTTSMLATLLEGAGLDPTVVVGGKVKGGSGARLGAGEVLVAEADESDGSFLTLSPVVAVVTNLDDEHLDHYGTPAAVDDAFVAFCNRVPFFGACVINLDDPRLARLLPRLNKRTITYGTTPAADLRLLPAATPSGDGPQTFQLVEQGRDLGPFHLWVAGRHNASNAAAAIAAARFLGAEVEALRVALADFVGVSRRFELLYEGDGVRVIDDYGHHPTEISATLAAARASWPGRLVALVQPHRYTRLAALAERFATALLATDVCLITQVYAAGEARGSGPDGRDLTELLRQRGHGHASFHPDLDAMAQAALAVVRPGDLLLTLGAGDITRLAHRLAAELGARLGTTLLPR